MADIATTKTADTAATPRTRPEGVKRVGADFTEAEYALIREARFVKRYDKDSEVIKAALNEFFGKHGITVDKS